MANHLLHLAISDPSPHSWSQELSERRALVQKKQEINADLERREKARREAMAVPPTSEDGRGKGTSQHTITEADIEEEQDNNARSYCHNATQKLHLEQETRENHARPDIKF